jgi:hypothetical protein
LPRFFHLQLQNSESGKLTDLLVTDVSGEAYRRAIDNHEDVLNLGFVRRADFFVLLLDGERLASKEHRQDGFRRGLLLLEALLQARVLSPECPVRVLIAKYDLLMPEEVDGNTTEFTRFVEAEYKRFGSEHFANFQLFRISSRPKGGSTLKYGFGVESQLFEWVNAENPVTVADCMAGAEPLPNERESVSYFWRQLGKKANVNTDA